jgi:hypothetical protein
MLDRKKGGQAPPLPSKARIKVDRMVMLIVGTTVAGDLARKINRNYKYIFSRGHTVRTGGTIIATIDRNRHG